MHEKHKRRPHRQFFSVFILLLILIGGYFSLPFAQTAFVRWWEDDPFTPICDMPDYRLAIAYRGSISSTVYTLSPNPRQDALPSGQFYWSSNISPNGRWILYYSASQMTVIDIATNQTLYIYQLQDNQWAYWLPDNRLLYRDPIESRWQIYNPETGYLETIPHSIGTGSSLRSFSALSGDNYFLAFESYLDEQNYHRQELVLYDHGLNRSVMHSFAAAGGNRSIIYGDVSPDGRFYVARYMLDYAQNIMTDLHELWLFDLEQEAPEPIHIADGFSPRVFWSPDSQYFAYSPDNYNNLNFYNVQTQEMIYSYHSTVQRIEMLGWNADGFWIQETSISENKYIVSWGSFDGTNIALNFAVAGDLRGVRPLANSDNLIMTRISSGFADEHEYNLLIVNPHGEILANIPNSFDSFTAQSPDNRYLAYRSRNDWLYILDFTTNGYCKAVSFADMENLNYDWYSLPQP